MSDCGHGALIAGGEARGLCPLCQRAEIGRLRAENDVLHKTDKWRYENVERMKAEIERLQREATKIANERAALAFDNERLRAVLRDNLIAMSSIEPTTEIAAAKHRTRRALVGEQEPKP